MLDIGSQSPYMIYNPNLLFVHSAVYSHYYCSKGRYNVVVGFSPTGWTHGKEQHKGGKCGRRLQRGMSVIHYQVLEYDPTLV